MKNIENMTISEIAQILTRLTNIENVNCWIFDAFVSGNVDKMPDANMRDVIKKARVIAKEEGYNFQNC